MRPLVRTTVAAIAATAAIIIGFAPAASAGSQTRSIAPDRCTASTVTGWAYRNYDRSYASTEKSGGACFLSSPQLGVQVMVNNKAANYADTSSYVMVSLPTFSGTIVGSHWYGNGYLATSAR